MSITELAPAKLNLTLDVGARRPDGYHEITSVMQSAALYDVVTLETVETDDIAVECPGTDLPTGRTTWPGKRRTSFSRRQISPIQGFSSDWRRKSPPRPVLEAAAVTPPPYCGA